MNKNYYINHLRKKETSKPTDVFKYKSMCDTGLVF